MGGAAAAAAPRGMNEDEETYAAELCAALSAARTEPAAFEERVLLPLRARYHGLLLDGGSGKSARRLTAEGRGGLEAAAFALRVTGHCTLGTAYDDLHQRLLWDDALPYFEANQLRTAWVRTSGTGAVP